MTYPYDFCLKCGQYHYPLYDNSEKACPNYAVSETWEYKIITLDKPVILPKPVVINLVIKQND